MQDIIEMEQLQYCA